MSERWGDKPELFEVFRSEVIDRLASLSEGLVALERGQSSGILERICRDAHSVKGSARLLGFEAICDVAHHMEDVLVVLRDGRGRLGPEVCDVLLSGCDALADLVEAGTVEHNDVTRAVCARLAAAFEERPGAANAEPVPVTQEAVREIASTTVRDPVKTEGSSAADLDVIDLGPPRQDPRAEHVAHSDGGAEPAATESGTGDGRSRRAGATVRLETSKIYALIDAVGEAVIGQVTLKERSQRIGDLFRRVDARTRRLTADLEPARIPQVVELLQQVREELAGVSVDLDDLVDEGRKQVEELQERAMALATFPAATVLSPLPRLARDLCRELGKEAELHVDDGGVELDKQILERISEPIRALLINALDHGIESPPEREAAGKAPRGTVTIRARQRGGQAVIEVSDDGRGVDLTSVRRRAVEAGWLGGDDGLSAADLGTILFRPGFSTAERSTRTSGRGVGLDIVRDAIEALKGGIEVHTEEARGTRFVLTVPTTLSIVEGVMVCCGRRTYAFPVSAVSEVVQLPDDQVQTVAGRPVVDLRDEILPLLPLAALLGEGGSDDASRESVSSSSMPHQTDRPVVILSYAGRSVALRVDGVGGQQEIVVKSLGTFVRDVRHVAGASILGNGDVVLVLDPSSLLLAGRVMASEAAALDETAVRECARVLVVDDSAAIREMERSILEAAGFEVEVAGDGAEALDLLGMQSFHAIVSDVQMPNIDGLELCEAVRATHPHIPFVMLTSLTTDEQRRRGLEVGADAYLTKADFDQGVLVEVLLSLIGT